MVCITLCNDNYVKSLLLDVTPEKLVRRGGGGGGRGGGSHRGASQHTCPDISILANHWILVMYSSAQGVQPPGRDICQEGGGHL